MSGKQGGYSLHIFINDAVVTHVLTGDAGFALMGQVLVSAGILDLIKANALALSAVTAPHVAAKRQLAAQMQAQLLFPALIAQVASMSDTHLNLVIAPDLVGIPWELAFSSPGLAQETLVVSRQTMLLSAGNGNGHVPAKPENPSVALSGVQHDNQRHVTVLQYDLVNSTRLIAEFGGEAYTGQINAMHAVCAEVVQDWGGFASNPQGSDGVMCYFGLPVAMENAASNALRAGLELVERVKKLGLQIRVGVVSGPVVVNAGLPYGMVIHLAARLQTVADPGSVAVAESTRQVVRDQFQFESLDGVPPLKGFDEPQVVYKLVGLSPQAESQQFSDKLQILVGRDAEIRLLQQHWRSVGFQGAKVLTLTGEAGIGKSSIVRAFRAAIHAENGVAMECRCTQEHVITAFYPLIDLLSRRIALPGNATPTERFDRVSGMIGPCDDHARCVTAVLDLLGYAPSAMDAAPELVRIWTLRGLTHWLQGLAQASPLCVIVEDVHWLDPSTREFLVGLRKACDQLPFLLLMTRRVEGQGTVPVELDSEQMPITGLARHDAEHLIRTIVGDDAMTPDLVSAVLDRADGVPLFLEESTRMMVDSLGRGALSPQAFAVPASLQDLLMARIDRMGSAKAIAQLGSVLGREFSRAVLLSMATRSDLPVVIGSVDAQVQRLIDGGLLGYKFSRDGGVYYFRHALTREAAYQSLWLRDRKQCHAIAADVLRHGFEDTVLANPVTLARHLEHAEQHADAIQYWERAARHAIAHSAPVEASRHIDHALALVRVAQEGDSMSATELRLLVLLAGQLLATQGYGADRVGEVYSRALVLADQRGDDRLRFRVLMGLEAYHFMRADFEQAQHILTQAQALIDRLNDPMPTLQWRWALANLLFHRGDLVDAVRHMDACLAEYHQLPQRAPSVQDPGIMCLCYSALAQWELGYADDALERAQRAIALSESMQHLFSQGESYGFCSTVHYFRGEYPESLACAEKSLKICQDGGFNVWVAHARIMRGRAMAALGDVSEGMAEMQAAYALWVNTGAQVTRPLYLAMLAEGLVLQGKAAEALVLLNSALALVRAHAEGYYEPEILRLIGVTTLQAAGSNQNDVAGRAKGWIEQAIELAVSRKLRSLEQRARASLAHLESSIN